MQPQRWQPTRLLHPWDSPGKNTGVGCHFLLQCIKVKSESEIAQLCPTPRDPMDCSPPGSSVHGTFQARVPEWGAIAFSRVSCYVVYLHKRIRFDSWVNKFPWRRSWHPTPVFLPRKSHGQRSLVGCSPRGCKKSDTTERLNAVKPKRTECITPGEP